MWIYTVLKIFSSFTIFEQLALALKFFTVWNILFTYRILSKLRLHWKTELPWNFSLYWICFSHSGVLSYLRLLWKAEGALNSLCWICIFYFQEFWATCACPENKVCPENFQDRGGGSPPRPPASYAYADGSNARMVMVWNPTFI